MPLDVLPFHTVLRNQSLAGQCLPCADKVSATSELAGLILVLERCSPVHPQDGRS